MKKINLKLPKRSFGFTMIEAIVTIVITGIVSASVALFIRAPVLAYVDSARRAEMADIADTALRRISRDLRLALPNSIRVTTSGSNTYVEFLQVRTGGRYRAEVDGSGAGNAMVFGTATTLFNTLGRLSTVTDQVIVPNSDRVVIFNLPSAGADAYTLSNTSVITSTANAALANESTINFNSQTFNDESPGKRFYVISGPVTYACNTATGILTRYWGYTIQATQPTTFVGASSSQLAQNVSSCTFTYDPNVLTTRAGVVSMWIRLTDSGESVNLFNQVHVSNTP